MLRFHTGIKYDIIRLAFASFDDRIIFEIKKKKCIIYGNCEIHLFLRFSFNRFKIMWGSSIVYKH